MQRKNAPNPMHDDTSLACFEDLNEHGLLGHYHTFFSKERGCMEGLEIIGARKNCEPKRVFVKKYQNYLGVEFHELVDHLVFELARALGIAAPKTKLRATTNNFYLFSTDIVDQQSIDKSKLKFVELKHILNRSLYKRLPQKNLLIDLESKKEINIDKISLAKLMIFSFILRLVDLGFENTGLLIEDKHPRCSAHFAIIDFCLKYKTRPPIKQIVPFSIQKLIESSMQLKMFLRSVEPTKLNETDYQLAFAEIEPLFIEACEKAMVNARQFTFESEENVMRATKLINEWKQVFSDVQNQVHEQHSPKHCHVLV